MPLGCLTAVLLAASQAESQVVRLPSGGVTKVFYQPPGTSGLAPIPQPASPSTTLGPPTFDPYATGSGAASTPPSLSPSTTSPYGSPPATSYPPASGFGAPSTTTPYSAPTTPYAAPGTPAPYGSSAPTYNPVTPQRYQAPGAYAQQPQVMFPNGFTYPQYLPQPQAGPYLRLLQDVRLSDTWIWGESAPNEMQSHDVETGTTLNFPNFLWSNQILQVSPVFVLHLWTGPETGPDFPTDLPAQAYSTYLDFGWDPRITPQLGADLDFSIGVYSDFNAITSDSIRMQGTGLLVLGLTPTMTLKGGITYLDRLDIDLLPAGGILWQPNPQTYFDIYFPRPKLAHYWKTIGNHDVWWYITGEIGGGTWTVDRLNVGGDKRMDIDDLRAGVGLEWFSHTGHRAFFEAGYVFERKLVFASGPIAQQDLKDTFMLRGGVRY